MRISTTIAASALLALVSIVPAHAEERVVPANRESTITFLAGVTASCRTSAKPKMKIVEAPAHGSVRFQWTKGKITNISKLCNGRPAWGMAILFKPTAGYRGKDSFTVGIVSQKYENHSDTRYEQGTIDVVVK
ncbi:hypothetical protein [Pararhizobium sp. O133]|uniref:hypothetical protein n=1 Tax=Pararhizobium sp. O133 TaxID=3449278 RepID=UPI003F682C8C